MYFSTLIHLGNSTATKRILKETMTPFCEIVLFVLPFNSSRCYYPHTLRPAYSLCDCIELRWLFAFRIAAEYLITTWWDCPIPLFMILQNCSSEDTWYVVKADSGLAYLMLGALLFLDFLWRSQLISLDLTPVNVSSDGQQGCQMAKFDLFLSLDFARVEGVGAQFQGKEDIKFCSVA